MAFTHRKISFCKIVQIALGVATAIAMSACGGGGGSAGTVPGTGSSSTSPASAALTLKLVNTSGAASSLVSTSSPLTAQAMVLDASGAPVPNTLVNFKTGQAFTTVTPSSGAVLTNSSGVATVTLAPATLAIAQTEGGTGDILTANATVGTAVLTATAPFSLGSTAVSLSLVSTSPVNLNAYSSTLIKVNVLANGAAYTASPVVVNFSSACAISGNAVLPATATTVNGQAQVTYTDNGCSTTDPVSISVAGASSITATLIVAPPVAASIEFVGATPAGEAIVIKGAGGNGRVETATLTFEALDTFGKPLPNENVTFSLMATQPVTLQATSAVTGANGQVVVAVNSGTLPTTFRVIATLPTGQSTLSDSISVTTGQPTQAAFSLSATTSNIEGWNYDDVQTTLNILLADQSGNPVADGTPVVFETDSGAVGSSANGGCTTTNGGCSVIFRSQNPRFDVISAAAATPPKRAGLATVSVSTTSAVVTLSGQIGVFLSGSFADHIVLKDANGKIQSPPVVGNSLNWTIPLPVVSIPLANCNTTYFQLQLNDVNFNPLPDGSTIADAASTQGANPTAVFPPANAIFPITVLDIGPDTLAVATMAADQGSWHTFVYTPGGAAGAANACNAGGVLGAGNGNIQVTITSPKGNVTLYTVNFTYPM